MSSPDGASPSPDASISQSLQALCLRSSRLRRPRRRDEHHGLQSFDRNAGRAGFVQAYRGKYGIMPTQRSFFAYEATNLVVAAIRRANSDKAHDIERALKTTTVPSLLGRTYAMDDHNHPHTPMQIVGMRNGKPERDRAGWRLRKRLTRRGRLGGLGRKQNAPMRGPGDWRLTASSRGVVYSLDEAQGSGDNRVKNREWGRRAR